MTAVCGWILWMFGAIVLRLTEGHGKSGDNLQVGPTFLVEPPGRIQFYNSTGVVIPCSAMGTPQPKMVWTKHDGTPIQEVSRLRYFRPDGSLIFPPFKAEEYRQDVHAAVYRCTASNVVGTIGSRDISIRAVIRIKYEIRTQDDFVIKGNTAVLKCYIPTAVKEFISVVSWETDDAFAIQKGTSDGKMRVSKEGTLLIEYANMIDGRRKYRCICRDLLDKETVVSATWGQLIVTEPTSSLPPRIRTGDRDIKCTSREKAEIVCVGQGYPVPGYKWYKKEGNRMFPLLNDQKYKLLGGSLFILNAVVQDTGSYICSANNSVGEDRALYHVFITEGLNASVHPSSLLVKEGASITLQCNVTGHMVTSVVWTKNLKPLMATSRVKLASSEILQITSVQREDKGMYQCFARTPDHSAQGSSEVMLEEDPPEFKEVFSDQILRPGARSSMRCVVSGNPLPHVSWYLYSKPVIENTNLRIGDFVDTQGLLTSFINLTSVTVEDGGLYTCQAKNEIATISHSARLSVFGLPLVHPMSNVTVVVGAEVQVDCAAAGYPIKAISWKKEEDHLARSQRLMDFQNGTFAVLQATKADEGWYRCEVVSTRGERAVGSMHVRVIEKPVINPFLFGDDLREGMRTMVVCSVLAGEPPIIISWLKDGMSLTSIHGDAQVASLGDFASSLTITSVSRQHAGNYTCKATSGAASTTYTAVMAVRASPRWVKQPEDKAAVLGSKVVFLCQAEGIPDPVHRWKYSSGPAKSGPGDFKSVVSSSHMYVLENGSLVITDVERGDEGLYLCEASNSVGPSLSAVVRLEANVPPKFNQTFEMKTVLENQEVVLSCNAHGEAPLIVSWKRYQRPIDRSALSRYVLREHVHTDGLNSQLWIAAALKSDSGLFTCEASNDYGKEERSIQLVVQTPPDPPENVQLQQVTSRSISFTWTTPPNGNSPITGYTVLYNRSKSQADGFETVRIPPSETKATVTGLSPATLYVFQVHAENSLGRSGPSQELSITTEEEAPSGVPLDIQALATSSNSVKVTWKSPLRSSYQGELLGYYIGSKEYGSTDPFLYKTVDLSKDKDGETQLTSLKKNTKYVITVQAFNSKGAGPAPKEVVVQTLEHDPPKSLVLNVISRSAFSVEVEWTGLEKDTPVSGYILHYKSDYGDWEETHISHKRSRQVVKNLRCGTKYKFTLTAFNNAGRGEPSDIITVQTTGGGPVAPDKNSLLVINATFVTLLLNAWNDGGCPVLFFVVQYKPQFQKEWILLSNNIVPAQTSVMVTDLGPGTWYDLLMAAHNDAGATEAEYQFATLTLSGATVPPLAATTNGSLSILRDPAVVVPIVCAIVVVVVITIVVAVVIILRRKEPPSDCRSQGVYSSSSGGKGENLSMSSYGKVKRSDPSEDGHRESLYYPTPYATTQLATYSDSPNMNPHCNTLRRHDRKGRDHEYDVPHRHSQAEDYTSYAKLWTHSRPPPLCESESGSVQELLTHQSYTVIPLILEDDWQFRYPLDTRYLVDDSQHPSGHHLYYLYRCEIVDFILPPSNSGVPCSLRTSPVISVDGCLPVDSPKGGKPTKSSIESYGGMDSDTEDVGQLTSPATGVGDIDELSETECDRYHGSWARIPGEDVCRVIAASSTSSQQWKPWRDLQGTESYSRRSYGDPLMRQATHVC